MSEELAEFIVSLEYKDLTKEVVTQSKMCVLDTLGTALFGSTRKCGKIVIEFTREMQCEKHSTIIGYDLKTCAPYASLANGTMAHSFELDDTYIPAMHHPGCVVIPAALSIGEKEHLNGEEIIGAVVAGYEVMNRIGDCFAGTDTMRGFFATGTNGTFGAAAAAGKLLDLKEDQMMSALGIAGNQATGLLECLWDGGMTKRLAAGAASQSGVTAALLAEKGLTGPTTIIEGKYGYCKTHSDKYDLSKLTENMGQSYSILSTAFKLYSCCKALHSPIDAMIDLVKERNLKPDDVEEVVIGGYKKLLEMHAIYNPQTILTAQFSLPYTVAVAFVKGRVGPDEFTEKSIRNQEILMFSKKVKIVVDPELAHLWPEHQPAKVTIKLKDGRKHSKTVIDPKGDPRNPVSKEELREKFKFLGLKVLPKKKILEIIKKVDHLERVTDISELTNILYSRNTEDYV